MVGTQTHKKGKKQKGQIGSDGDEAEGGSGAMHISMEGNDQDDVIDLPTDPCSTPTYGFMSQSDERWVGRVPGACVDLGDAARGARGDDEEAAAVQVCRHLAYRHTEYKNRSMARAGQQTSLGTDVFGGMVVSCL